MQEHYCGWCGAKTVGSYNGDTWVCGICHGSDHIPGKSGYYTVQ
ncbi:hypothetical protein [Halalkalicoccus jeotgali]|nr:hypothetical protein [Halalkalicoccus jeotgali]